MMRILDLDYIWAWQVFLGGERRKIIRNDEDIFFYICKLDWIELNLLLIVDEESMVSLTICVLARRCNYYAYGWI